MPELPEIEIVKRSLLEMILRAKIIHVKIKNKKLRYKVPNFFSKQLKNQKILKIERRSKYLIFHLNKYLLLAHLGMTGKFLIIRSKDSKLYKTSFYYNLNILTKHNHIYFKLNNGLILVYNDVRKFGFFKLIKKNKLNKIIFLKKLGLEPLSNKFNTKYFLNFVEKRNKNIKNLLMDQKFVSGLGNIYVNESLFMSKIHPLRVCNSLKKKEINRLINKIKKILKISISKGGSSIRDFKNTSGQTGSFQQFFKVYGRENEDCSRISCNNRIKKIFISNRSSFYCPKCQK
tara:strand:- start:30 stop:893 length:864 start_codon:yes stop_codon:yes gene_type:complete